MARRTSGSSGHGRGRSATGGSSRSSISEPIARGSLDALQDKLGHRFADLSLLKRALTHSSADSSLSNERLEFLGDRVLGLILAEDLHAEFPSDPEGTLALKYNALARREACVAAGEAAGIPAYLILAASEAGSGGRLKAAIVGGAVEAVIAALYLDGGMAAARRFVESYWKDAYGTLGNDMRDPKTALQEWAQGRKGKNDAPAYRVVNREGPDHAPRFVVEVSVEDHASETGEGRSKREAEQAAARAMLQRLGLLNA